MKIAIFGTTLHAGVMAALLAERGNDVLWCTDHDFTGDEEQIVCQTYQEQDVNRLLLKQRQVGFLKDCSFSSIPLDIEAYLFCFSPTELEKGLEVTQRLNTRPIIHPRLMVNGSTFGLHGTEKLKQNLPKDHWVYFPDMIQEGNAINSVLSVKHVIVGVESDYSKTIMHEMLRPFFALITNICLCRFWMPNLPN